MRLLRPEVFVAFLAVMGCTKDEAEQTADWTRNVDTAQKYAAKFPAFKSVIEKRTAEAQASFDAAKAVAEKNPRAEAMGAANRMLTELTQEFGSYESASKALADTLSRHSTLPSALEVVTKSAREAQKTAEQNMGGFEPTNVGAAKAKIEDAVTLLKEATEAVDSTDRYVAAEKTLNELLVDKELLALPAEQVNPVLEAAKTAQRNAGYALIGAAGPPATVRDDVVKATKLLTEAAAPLKALKPAPVKPAATKPAPTKK